MWVGGVCLTPLSINVFFYFLFMHVLSANWQFNRCIFCNLFYGNWFLLWICECYCNWQAKYIFFHFTNSIFEILYFSIYLETIEIKYNILGLYLKVSCLKSLNWIIIFWRVQNVRFPFDQKLKKKLKLIVLIFGRA